METIVTEKGCSILNDTYNANPASMRAGLMTLGQFTTGKKFALLGDMLELGESSKEAHFQIGEFAAGQDVDQLIVVGEFARDVSEGARMAGLGENQVLVFERKEDVIAWLKQPGLIHELGQGDWLLVKGSRGMKLETIVEMIMSSDL